MEVASSLCDPNPSSLLHEGVLGSSEPERRPCVHQKLSGSSTSENEIKCQMDHKKGIEESASPLTLAVSPGGGSQDRSRSRMHLKNGTTLSKKGRNLAQEPSKCQNGSSLSVGDQERESEKETDSPAVLSSPSAATEQGLCAKGRHSVSPSGSPTVHPAHPDVQGPPGKQLCSGGSQRSGLRGCMTLESTSRLGPSVLFTPSDNTCIPVLEEGGSVPELGQGGILVFPPEPGPMCF